MTVHNIDTFEQDVAEEIKKKEASFTDIASARGVVENTPSAPHRASLLIPILSAVFFLVLMAGAGGFYYLSKTDPSSVPPQPVVQTTPANTMSVQDISHTLNKSIGPYVESVEKTEYGYILKLAEYSPVFIHMLRNESSYAEEIAASVGSPRDTSTSTPPFTFRDVTRSNQNMRVGTSASSTVIYAFVNTTHLVISQSIEGAVALRSVILKQ